MNDIYNVDWLLLYPDSIKKDETMQALAKVFIDQINKIVVENLNNVLIYANLGELTEGILKQLAEDFSVDWYDDSFVLEQKRRIIKNAMLVQRTKGTAGAVETALSDTYKNSSLVEWFEYGGRPFYFRVYLSASESGMEADTLSKVIEKIKTYKNARSHLEKVYVENRQTGEIKMVGGLRTGRKILIQPYQVAEYVDTGRILASGGVARITKVVIGGGI